MKESILSDQEMLAIVAEQEALLRFASFSPEDAWELGLKLRENGQKHGGDMAMDITVSGLSLFRCAVGRPSPNNSRWIQRKINTVSQYWKSSLRVFLELKLSGRTLEESGWSQQELALSGGCFPLRLGDSAVIGTVTVSGLPHTHDHQLIADTLAEHLGVPVRSVLP